MNTTPHIRSFNRLFAVALVATSVAVPTVAQARPADSVMPAGRLSATTTQDLRSPDASQPIKAPPKDGVAYVGRDLRTPDAIQPVHVAPVGKDLRTPDAVDAGKPAKIGGPYRDLRPLDINGKPVTVAPAPSTPVAASPKSDFDLPSAGIGAGIAMGLILLGFAAITLTLRRRPGRSALLS